MARKALDSQQRALLAEIAQSASAETVTLANLRIKQEQEMAAARRTVRQGTNALIYKAIHRLGISKTVVSEMGLDQTGRQNLYDRLREIAETATPESLLAASIGDEPVKVRTVDDGMVLVELVHFDNADLGEDLSGTFLYNAEGEFVSHVIDDDRTREIVEANPLFAVQLYTTGAVQEQL